MEDKSIKESNVLNLNLNKNFQNQVINNAPNLFEGFLDTLEGIIDNEPQNNKYEAIKFHKLNEYPYFLIGKVVSKFDIDGQNQHLKGVGILVGPDVVLTVAHNICHMTANASVYTAKQVYFEPVANGKFNLFEKVKFRSYYIPEDYTKALTQNDEDFQLYNDWGLIFLSQPVGDYISKYFDIKNCKYIENINGLYRFFANNEMMNSDLSAFLDENFNLNSIRNNLESNLNFNNNSIYKSSNSSNHNSSNMNSNTNQINKENNNMNNFSQPAQTSNKNSLKISIIGYSKNKINNLKNQFSQKYPQVNANSGMGNIRAGESAGDLEIDKNININININTKENRQFFTEGLFKTSANNKLIRNKQLENMGNGIDYILFNNEELNRDFNDNDDENLIMTESKGSLRMEIKGIDNYIKHNLNNMLSNGNNAYNTHSLNNSIAPIPEYDTASNNPVESCLTQDLDLYKSEAEKLLTDNNNNNPGNKSTVFPMLQYETRKLSDSLAGTNAKSLRYPISTYKGQSGSPIFLRIKKNDNNPKQKYLYIFIGLHSRRGPIVNEKFNEISNMSNCNSNSTDEANKMLNNNNNYNLVENLLVNEKENLSSDLTNNLNIKKYFTFNSLNNTNNNSINNQMDQKQIMPLKPEEAEYNNIILKNGICNYNVALNILGDTSKNIMDVINKNKTQLQTKERPQLNSEFVLVKLYDKDNLALKGLFKNQLNMQVLFEVATDFKKLPIEFIRFRPFNDQFNKNFLTYNHDREKCLYKLIENEEENSELAFYISINKNTYSRFIADNIFNKFCENFNIDKVKLDFKKYSKYLFDSIFTELKGYDPNSSFYGKFFKLIRDHILKKIGVDF